MATRSGWGSLVAAAVVPLAAGCMSPPQPPAKPPPPQAFRLGPLKLAAPKAPAPGGRDARIREMHTALRYGRGFFSHSEYTWIADDPWDICPTQGAGPSCGSFRVWSSGQPAPDSWRIETGPLDAASSAAQQPAPRSWDQFSPGRDAIYAHGVNSPVVDRIDDQGQVSVLVESERLRAPAVFVLEAGPRLYLLVGGPDDEAKGTLVEVVRDESSGGHKLGPSVELPMAPIAWWSYRADGARLVEEKKLAAMYGYPVAVPLADKKSKDAWAMVWVEALPPPILWPKGRPYKRPGRRLLKAKHNCGGAQSRPLTDTSVEKRVHLTRFYGLKMQEDQVVASADSLDPLVEPLRVGVVPKGISINGVVYNRAGAAQPRLSKPLPPTPPFDGPHDPVPVQEIVLMEFDYERRSGALLLSDGASCWRRHFDAEGRYDGPPEKSACAGPDARVLDNPLPPDVLVRQPDGALEIRLRELSAPLPVEPQPDPGVTLCNRAIRTSSTTVLLACSEAADPERPGIFAGLRRLELR